MLPGIKSLTYALSCAHTLGYAVPANENNNKYILHLLYKHYLSLIIHIIIVNDIHTCWIIYF